MSLATTMTIAEDPSANAPFAIVARTPKPSR
jgi:hypothetical protein